MFDLRTTILAAACVLALGACGDKNPPPAEAPPPPPPVAAETTPPMPEAEPAAPAVEAPVDAAPAVADEKGVALVSNCATTIVGNDAMQFDVSSITVPASCAKFTINLNHSGKMPAAAMGHNVVISAMSDMQAIASEGIGQGLANNYIKADDPRVLAHTKVIGAGESTSVTFDTSKIKGAGPYEFFCSFPGHSAIMKGTIRVG